MVAAWKSVNLLSMDSTHSQEVARLRPASLLDSTSLPVYIGAQKYLGGRGGGLKWGSNFGTNDALQLLATVQVVLPPCKAEP